MTTKTTVTQEQADAVLAAVLKQLCVTDAEWAEMEMRGEQSKPQLIMDWDWLGLGACPSIVWEEGPGDWAHLFPDGGIEEEFGFKVKDVSEAIPAGVHTEAITSWSVGIYRDDA